MHKEGDEIHIEDDEAMAGQTGTGMRWVLILGLALAIGILSLMWITGAISQNEAEEDISRNSDGSLIENNETTVADLPEVAEDVGE